MRVFVKRWLPLYVALLLMAAYLLLHLHFMSRFIDTDQVVYTWNIIEMGDRPFFNPHHLHYEFGAQTFHRLLSTVAGEYGLASLPFNVRLYSLVFGVLGIGFAFLYLREMTSSYFFAIAGAVLVGVSHGYLLYSAKIDTAIFPAAWLPVMLYVARRFRQSGFRLIWGLLLGSVMGLSVFFHQYHGITCAAICVSLLVPAYTCRSNEGVLLRRRCRTVGPEGSYRRRYPALLVAALLALGIISAGYVYAGLTHYGLDFEKRNVSWNSTFGVATFQEWVFFYKVVGNWGNVGFEELDYRQGFRGLTDSFFAPSLDSDKWNKNLEFDYDLPHFTSTQALPSNLLALALGLLILFLVWFFPGIYRLYGPDLLLLLLCMAGFTALAVHWEPFYVEFWVLPAVIYTLLGVLVLNYCSRFLGRMLSPLGSVPVYMALLLATVMLLGYNLRDHLAPYSDRIIVQGVGVWKPDHYMFISAPEMYRNSFAPREGQRPAPEKK